MKALYEQADGCNVPLDRLCKRAVHLIAVVVSPLASGRFAVRHDGRLLVSSSSTPFCAAARVLLDEGIDPATCLIMRHERSDTIALAAQLGSAAKLTIDENNGTIFARWKPFLRSAVSPAIASKASARTRTAATPTKPMGEATAETSPFAKGGGHGR